MDTLTIYIIFSAICCIILLAPWAIYDLINVRRAKKVRSILKPGMKIVISWPISEEFNAFEKLERYVTACGKKEYQYCLVPIWSNDNPRYAKYSSLFSSRSGIVEIYQNDTDEEPIYRFPKK